VVSEVSAQSHDRRLVDLAVLQRRIRVAQGQEPGDLLLRGGHVVNVFTQQVEPANIIIAEGWIAAVGPHEWNAREVIDITGQVVIPGLIDGHIHVESTLLMPAELAKLVVPRGTTALIADPHEVGNVLGIPGIDLLLKASEELPLDLFCMASSCVPATRWDDAGAVLGPTEVSELLTRPRVLGLAEVMDMDAVLRGDAWVLEKIRAAQAAGKAVDGHAPGMSGKALLGYAAAGIRSDHESTTIEEARAKAALGMMVQVREGSAEHNLDTLLPLLAGNDLGDWCFCSDDVLPDDLVARGHLDALLRRAVAGGVPAAKAVRHASLVPARHYGLNDRGAIAPGFRADLAVVENLSDFRARLVLKEGDIVARDGKYVVSGERQSPGAASNRATDVPPSPLAEVANTVHLAPVDESAFVLRLSRDTFPTIRVIPHQIVTAAETATVKRQDGQWVFDPARDVLLAASLERHRATGRIGLGLVAGFGLKRHGALGSSVAHDAHNLIVAGTNPRDMLACVRALAESGGGFVVAADGQVTARLPLPVAGLLSLQEAGTVCRQLHEVNAAARSLGCPLEAPFGYLSFLALPVIPALRITDQGLYDVNAQQFLVSP
jgi:adenine deaminase